MTDLKLIALDAEDLGMVSAHLQDAVFTVEDMAYLPNEQRFAVVLNRFDWEGTLAGGRRGKINRRRRSALRFDRVTAAQLQKIDVKARDRVLSLLTIGFEPGMPPAGFVTLVFAGGAAIRLEVECIEVELRDLGAAWSTKHRPDHGTGEEPASGKP